MKVIKIQLQDNKFNATKMDKHESHYKAAWELFTIMYPELNGNITSYKAGVLVKHFDNSFTVFHGAIKYNLSKKEVTFI